MSRSLVGFVSFCLLLAVATALGVWYMGPTLAGIAVDSESRESPYYLVNLMVEDDADSMHEAGTESRPGYRAGFLTLAAKDGAELRWQASSLQIVEGSPLLAINQAQLLRFPTGGDLVQMLTGSGYRQLESSRSGSPAQLLGTAVEPAAFPMHGAIVVALLRMKAAAPVSVLGSPEQAGWLGLVDDYGGRVLWNASLDTVRGTESWDRVLAMHFPDQPAAEAWLSDPTTVTERSIAQRVIEDVLLLVASQSG